jgi:hypothetical protein
MTLYEEGGDGNYLKINQESKQYNKTTQYTTKDFKIQRKMITNFCI